MNPCVCIALLLVAFYAAPALANDAEYGNFAGTPAPVKNTAIAMAAEDITITARTAGGWDVVAVYTFENTTEAPVKLTMGFPEMAGDDPDEFLSFKTFVDSVPAKITTKKSAPFSAKGLANLGRVHLFDVAFAAKQRVEVRHVYHMQGGGSVAVAIENTVQYVTRTGALWKGPIGTARFTIRTLDTYELVAWEPEFTLKSLKHVVITKGERTGMEIVFENQNWTPKGDLRVDLVTDEGPMMARAVGGECPRLEYTDYQGFQEAPRAQKSAFLKVEGLEQFDTKRLRLCRNWRFARYGYRFKSADLNQAFYGGQAVGLGWYPPGMEDSTVMQPTKRMLAPLLPDPAYSPDMLTFEDAFYIRALSAAERQGR